MSSSSASKLSLIWNMIKNRMEKNEGVYISQIVILYIVIITCIVNLSCNNGKNELWTSLLSYSLGCLLPSPKIKKKSNIDNGSTYSESSV